MKIIFDTTITTMTALSSAVVELGNDSMFRVFFREPVQLIENKGKIKYTSKAEMRLSVNGLTHYSFSKRTWHPLVDYDKVYCIETVLVNDKMKNKAIESLLKSKHPNVWKDLDKIVKTNSDLQKYSITGKVDKSFIDNIKYAMDDKRDVDLVSKGKKRDMYVKCWNEDDDYKATFSSRLKDSDEGDYYTLINPTTATMKVVN